VWSGLLILAGVLVALSQSTRPPPRWIPVLAEVTGLRLIRTHVQRPDSAAVSWMVQYRLSYQLNGQAYSNHLLVQRQQPLQSLSLTTRESEYWLLTQAQDTRLPIQVWVNANQPSQIR